MDAREVHARRLNAKEVLMPKNGEHFIFSVCRWNSQVVWKRSGFPKIHPNPGSPCKRRIVKRASRKHASHICSHHAHRWSGRNTRCRRAEMPDPLQKKPMMTVTVAAIRVMCKTHMGTLCDRTMLAGRGHDHTGHGWVVAFSITEMEVRLVRH